MERTGAKKRQTKNEVERRRRIRGASLDGGEEEEELRRRRSRQERRRRQETVSVGGRSGHRVRNHAVDRQEVA